MQPILQYNDDDKFIIDNLSVLTGLSFEQIKGVLEYLLLFQLTQYLDGKPLTIPYLGNLFIEYTGDEIIRGHTRAILKSEFHDSELLKRIIGEIEDGSNSTILSILKNFVENKLLYLLEEDSISNDGKDRKHGSGQSKRKLRGLFEFDGTDTGI